MAFIFPPELHELIIDELRLSFPELKACSLVCKAWLPRCRFHLFRIIRIGPRRVCGIEKERFPVYFKRFQTSFIHTFKLPEIISCVQGISFESRIRDIIYNPEPLPVVPTDTLPQGQAILRPSFSSIDLPFQHLQFLRIHWRLLNMLYDGSGAVDTDIQAFEQVLSGIDRLEHLVVEKYRNFHANRDLLCSIAVHAPHLKTLCLSELRWFPSFSPFVLEDIFDEWRTKFAALGVRPLSLDRLCVRNCLQKGTNIIQSVVLPSTCLDLRRLRYLAMPATELQRALDDERFSEFGQELIHLTITNLDTPLLFQMESFPKLSELQLFVKDDWLLLQSLQNLGSHYVSSPVMSLNLHINFDAEFRGLSRRLVGSNNALLDELEEFNDILTSSVDPALHTLIRAQAGGFSMR
ncbi:hypothetical protein BDP27DRAFT_672481 [Rhodocollybia butyracea]|uniref:F-box domain-containing protein n=1 Tax=Rhodocollybia butyracea TaxID=206335 RepID=A0A9P5U7B9_9AGAR|nr:hypothetical protein BDP27DRAFT_672481 [Rhodocollybia butyracea]